MSFKSLATGAMLVTAGFVLGAVYANWSYDYYLVWVSPTPAEMLTDALRHYRIKASQPAFLHHVLHGVFLIGGLSAISKLYKPTESNTLFDGGSLFLFFICVVFYIANLVPASHSLITGDWNDIDAETGVKFISASQILMVLAIFGVLALQFGQWWAGDDQPMPSLVQEPPSDAADAADEASPEPAAATTAAATTAAATAASAHKRSAKKQ